MEITIKMQFIGSKLHFDISAVNFQLNRLNVVRTQFLICWFFSRTCSLFIFFSQLTALPVSTLRHKQIMRRTNDAAFGVRWKKKSYQAPKRRKKY